MNENRTLFSLKEIPDILKVCKDSGVSFFKLADLEVHFGPVRQDEIKLPDLSDEDHKENNRQGLLSEELRTKEDQLADMLIRDPLGAEELLMKDGDIINGESGSNEDDD